MVSGDLEAIADALDDVPDGIELSDVPECVYQATLNRGGSTGAAKFAAALVRAMLKTTATLRFNASR